MNICVFGASSDSIAKEYFDAAEEFGRCLGLAGHTLVFGGGNSGLMGAAARGALSAGAGIIGIAPSYFDKPGVLFEQCTEFIYTETMSERKTLMTRKSDAFAVLPGGMGTYDELFEILTLRQLGRMPKPVAVLNTRSYFNELRALLEKIAAEGFMDSCCLDFCGFADTPAALIHYLEITVPDDTNYYKY